MEAECEIVADAMITHTGAYNLNFTPAVGQDNLYIRLFTPNVMPVPGEGEEPHEATASVGLKLLELWETVQVPGEVFGTVCKGKDEYRFGFNGQEKVNEVAGIGNHTTALFWEYDTRLGRRWNLDPVDQISISNYAAFANSPIWFSDPFGNVAGDYYKSDGTYLGSDGIDDDKTYLADGKVVTMNKDGTTTTTFDNATELPIGHNQFQTEAATIYGESSAYKSNRMTDDLKKEMFGIAYVHLNNKTAYGANSSKAKEFMGLTLLERNISSFKRTANAAIINAHTGGFDYSFGATHWGGAEQAGFGANDNRFSNGTFEIHKNTIGWNISDNHYQAWKANVGKSFIAPQISHTPNNGKKFNRYYVPNSYRFISTAVYGGTIFWRELSKPVMKR